MIRAVYYNHLEAVKVLLKRGVDIEKRTSIDLTALLIAIARKKTRIVEYLI